MKNSETKRSKVLIIGGSMAGMMAARVLSDFYRQVTILERDDLSNEGELRRGVPHGGHAHGLLASGSEVIERLFPGISRELIDAGAVSADVVNDGKWFFEGGCLRQVPSGTMGILLSRPFLENVVRQRVRRLDRVEVIDNCPVRHLLLDKDRVVGVVTDKDVFEADLVIDASGRGSQSQKLLSSVGFAAPAEERVEVQIGYTTRYFHRRETDLGGSLFAAITASPGENTNSAVILAQEDDRWVVTLVGRFGVRPPEDLDGFIDFAKRLPAPYIYDAIRDAKPIGNALTMRFPASVRRRYEKLNVIPKGFVAFGDAICSFNPVYGQGMSVAALQALALRDQHTKGDENLEKRFYKAAAKLIDIPWGMAVGADLRLPNTRGKRTLGSKIMGWYVSKLQKFAHRDAAASLAFLRVAQLLDDPSTLIQPALSLRVLTAGLRQRSNTTSSRQNRWPTPNDLESDF